MRRTSRVSCCGCYCKVGQGGSEYLSIGNLLWRPDPLNLVADILDGVDEAAHVAGDVVEEVNLGHGDEDYCLLLEDTGRQQRSPSSCWQLVCRSKVNT